MRPRCVTGRPRPHRFPFPTPWCAPRLGFLSGTARRRSYPVRRRWSPLWFTHTCHRSTTGPSPGRPGSSRTTPGPPPAPQARRKKGPWVPRTPRDSRAARGPLGCPPDGRGPPGLRGRGMPHQSAPARRPQRGRSRRPAPDCPGRLQESVEPSLVLRRRAVWGAGFVCLRQTIPPGDRGCCADRCRVWDRRVPDPCTRRPRQACPSPGDPVPGQGVTVAGLRSRPHQLQVGGRVSTKPAGVVIWSAN